MDLYVSGRLQPCFYTVLRRISAQFPAEHRCILASQLPPQINSRSVWILYKPDCSLSAPAIHAPTAVVLRSHDRNAVQLAARCSLPAVTCGFSPRDTLTLSSIDGESAQICLQRSFTALDGSFIEACEFPIRLSGQLSQEQLLLLCGAIMLCGHAKLPENTLL